MDFSSFAAGNMISYDFDLGLPLNYEYYRATLV